VALDDESANWLKFTWTRIRPLAVNASATCCPKAATAGVLDTASAAESAAAFRMTADGSPLALAQTAAQADRCVLAPPVRLREQGQVIADGGGLGRVRERGAGRDGERVRAAVPGPGDDRGGLVQRLAFLDERRPARARPGRRWQA